jgi:nifR3 family TIM-barrel protein
MGCPVPKLFGNGEGSALMASPSLIFDIVSAVVNAVKLPVTVKIRSGIDDKRRNAVDCAKAAEAAGASLIAVHGRTRVQMYSGLADREIIKNVKNSVQIPVIGNGDINTAADALSMIRETGVDGVMIARGAVGNPFIFSEVAAALDGRTYEPPSLSECIETALLQLSLSIEHKGETLAVLEGRKQMSAYLKGLRGASLLRGRIHQATTFEEMRALFEESLALSEENSQN